MLKNTRQQKISHIIKNNKIKNQHELLAKLHKEGLETNQAAVSRDLNEMGIFKIKGYYRLPQIEFTKSNSSELYSTLTAGDNLIVIKTFPGNASAIGFIIDELNLNEVVGTLQGDDTLFVAVKNRKDQTKALGLILKHFSK